MTHPHTLHAQAAAASLAASLVALEQSARAALDGAVDGSSSVREVSIPSQVFGRRTALGGHGDPTATAALGAWASGHPNPYAALLGDMLRQLDQLAAHVPGAPGMDPVARIRQAIPGMRPHIAARTRQALQHLDGQVRRRLELPPALAPLPGNPPCRACGLQMLQVHTTDPARPVVCTADCYCRGDRCGCGIPGAAEGVQHIWLPEHLPTLAAGAVAGAAPTRPTN